MSEKQVTIEVQNLICNADGVIKPGSKVTLPESKAKPLIEGRAARLVAEPKTFKPTKKAEAVEPKKSEAGKEVAAKQGEAKKKAVK